MTDNAMIVVAVTSPGPDAAHVVALLQAQGIPASVDEPGGGVLPGLQAGFMDRVGVRVAAQDAARARRCLEQSTFAALTTPVSAAEKQSQRQRELTKADFARYAYRSALFGVLLWPLQIYTVYLLLTMRAAPGKLVDRARTEARIAKGVVGFMGVGGILILVFSILGQRSAPELDLRELPHPEILWGRWEGDLEHDDPERVHVKLHLTPRGYIRYEESGDHEAVCIGTWAYTNNLFYVHFTDIEESRPVWRPKLRELLGFDVDRVDADALILRYDRDTVCKFQRQPRQK